MRWVSVAAGAIIVSMALIDIVLTVLHAQKESRISGAFHRVVWRVLRIVARVVPPGQYHRVLAWAIPAMVGGLVGLWIAMLILGYALIYLPWIGDAGHFHVPRAPGGLLADALYFSGTSISTVGYGDLYPVSGLFRFLSVTEALSGLIVITLSITYLLTLYPSLSLKNSVATSLNEETQGRIDAIPMVARYLMLDSFDALGDRLMGLNDNLLLIAEAHRYHSVLYYSHPVEAERSLVRVLLVVRGLVGTVQFGLYEPDARNRRAYWRDPRIQTLHSSFAYTLRTLVDSIHVDIAEEIKDDAESREFLCNEYARLRAELFRLGLISSQEGGAPEEFATFRVQADNYINAYRKHAGYHSGEVEREIKPAHLL